MQISQNRVRSVSYRQMLPSQKRPVLQAVRTVFGIITTLTLLVLMVWGGLSIASLGSVSADAPIPEIRSGVSNYCLDAHHADFTRSGYVQAWVCNGTTAQDWSFSGGKIEHAGKYCLAVERSKIAIVPCSTTPYQNWLRYGVGFKNNQNGQCMALPKGMTGLPLVTASCTYVNTLGENWTPDDWSGVPLSNISSPECKQNSLGARVACVAEQQWLAWQTEPKLQPVLMSDYTAGNSNEEWCADFVSYVYLQAGSPFTTGERGIGGWDEYNANNIIDTGMFTYHSANSGYQPKPGDVAYFNYLGGHVEIVVSGGRHPTFIYGDSATIDPLTGNGDMAKNQIVNDGSAGGLVYYLSPN